MKLKHRPALVDRLLPPLSVTTTTIVIAIIISSFPSAQVAISTSEPKEATPNETLGRRVDSLENAAALQVSPSPTSTSQASQPARSKSHQQQQQPNPKTPGGRARKSSHQQARTTTTSRSPNIETTASTMGDTGAQLTSTTEVPIEKSQEEIRRLIYEYSNTPPLFLTTTRDFFVDVARYPLGFKLTTVQAMDSEGDPIEYLLQPATTRDASPYFAINSTSGELRLANRRFQLSNSEQSGQTKSPSTSSADGDDDLDESEADEQTDGSSASPIGDSALDNSSHTYFLNVAANDGHYFAVVELQIHFFNSSSLGTKSPVQLTKEGSFSNAERIESLLRDKSNKFFDELTKTDRQSSINNSTLVYPNFINPSLTKPVEPLVVRPSVFAEQPAVKPARTEEQRTLSTRQESLLTIPLNPQQPTVGGSWQQRESTFVAAPNQQAADQVMPQMMISLVIVFCAVVVIALVLLIFIVPISVKLRRRLKTVEMQHEQLSQRNSTNCSSSTAGSMMTNNSVGPDGNFPSLSQFTLSDNSSSHVGGNRGSSIICRQSSLDSALTGGFATISSSTMYNQHDNRHFHSTHSPANLLCKNPNNHMNSYLFQHQHQQQQQQLANGLNRVNNGLIANPLYLHQQSNQLAYQHDHKPALPAVVGRLNNNYLIDEPHHHNLQHRQVDGGNSNEIIYYPLDDEFYSTINVDQTSAEAGGDNSTPVAPSQQFVGSLVGRTSDSRSYMASQCAQIHNPMRMQCNEVQKRPEPLVRGSESPDSCASTKSLARVLSLPARHWAHKQQQQLQNQADGDNLATRDCDLINFSDETLHHHKSESAEAVTFKTIARASQVEREKQTQHKRGEKQHWWELERHEIRWLDILDTGQFGMVFRCKLRSADKAEAEGGKRKTVTRQKSVDQIASNQEELTVAVKTLKKSAVNCERERAELLAEIDIMKMVCDHPNVVKILHCCTRNLNDSNPPLLVMEYVQLGKLQSFLKKSRINHTYAATASPLNSNSAHDNQQAECRFASPSATPTPSPSFDNQLTSRDLIKFIYHVAKGMEYISSNFIVHRDLASRNILVDSQLICKVGDFGMARHMRSSGDIYERRSSDSKIPVRWMAPEVLHENTFTTKSDVFSFGILMWEVVTLGSTPYRHLRTEQVIDAVAQDGERPSKPEYCHSQLYEIMSKCWSHRPDDRPTFGVLVQQLDELLLSANEYIRLDQYPEHQYCNIPRQFVAPYELV